MASSVGSAAFVAFVALRPLSPLRCVRYVRCVGWKRHFTTPCKVATNCCVIITAPHRIMIFANWLQPKLKLTKTSCGRRYKFWIEKNTTWTAIVGRIRVNCTCANTSELYFSN